MQDAQLARAAWQMAAEVLAARPDQLDAFMQDQGECWHEPCCAAVLPLQRCKASDHHGCCLDFFSEVAMAAQSRGATRQASDYQNLLTMAT